MYTRNLYCLDRLEFVWMVGIAAILMYLFSDVVSSIEVRVTIELGILDNDNNLLDDIGIVDL